MERLSKFVRSRMALRQIDSRDHLLGNELNAFLEGALRPDERNRALVHLSGCPECREILALVSVPSEATVDLIPARRRTAMWKWRVAAGIAAAASVVAIIWFPHSVPEQQISKPSPVSGEVLVLKTPPTVSPASSVRVPQQAQRPKNRPAVPQIVLPQRAPETQPNDKADFRDGLSSPAALPAPSPPIDKPVNRDASAHVEGGNIFAPRMQSVKVLPASPFRGGVLWDIATRDIGNGNENGTLLRSNDGGKSWQSVRVDGKSRLDALSVSGPEIWVGGADGALFHSGDNGSNWARIAVTDGESRLTGTITRIAVGGDRSIRLTVSGEGDWMSRDGGLHWQQR